MIPYTPSRLYEPDSTIIQLIQRAGAQRADAQRRSGELWGGAVSGIGQLAAGTLRDIAERRDFDRASAAEAEAEAPRLEDEAKLRGLNITKAERELSTADDEAATAERLGALFAGDAPPTPNQIMGVMAKQPQRGLEIVKGLGALQEGSEKKYRDQMTLLRDAVRGVAATPDALKPQAWQMARGNLLSRNLITEDMAPAEYTPEGLASVLNFGQEPAKPDSRSLEVQLADARASGDKGRAAAIVSAIADAARAGRAPEGPKAPVYREIDGKTYIMEGTTAKPVNVPGAILSESEPSYEKVFVGQPAFHKLTGAAKTQTSKAAGLILQAKAYRDLVLKSVGENGLILTGPQAAVVNSANGQLLFTGAGGYGQGALQAPDKATMKDIFPNPASLDPRDMAKAKIRGGKEGLKQSLDAAIKKLNDDLYGVYGVKVSGDGNEAPLGIGTTVAAPSPRRGGESLIDYLKRTAQ